MLATYGRCWSRRRGYVPFNLYGAVSNQRRESGSGTGSILIRRDISSTYNVELAEIPQEVSGTARFGNWGSFHGALGLATADESAGDFIYRVYMKDSETPFAQICACYDGQRGVVELGDYGSRELGLLPIPPIGYVVQQYLEIRPGYAYVSKSREGLEGNFLVFRVDSISEDSATVTYLFR